MQMTNQYMLPVGAADHQRLDALGAIYSSNSLRLFDTHCKVKNPKILDVGCGNGRLTCQIAKLFNESKVVGVDKSPEQINVSRNIASEEGVGNVSWQICDVYKLVDLKEIYPELFDIVHTRFVLTHMEDIPKALDQMLALVKPGGILILEEVGANKKFKETPIKAIQAWKCMVDFQHQVQKSHPDTTERAIEHLTKSPKVSNVISDIFEIRIEGQLKKSMFRMGAEHFIKKIEELGKPELINLTGYEERESLMKEMHEFETNDSIILEIEGNESLVVKTQDI